MPNLLIADDEEEIVESLKLAFEMSFEGLNVITADNGLEAYRRAHNQSFDLICTDFRMPKLNGKDFIIALREQVFNRNTPIFLISGVSQEAEEIQKDFENVFFFEKPFKSHEIMVTAKELFESHKSHRKVQLDSDFINPFVEAAQSVLATFGEVAEIIPGKPFVLKKGATLGVDISATIPLISPQFKGLFAIGFPERTFLKVVSAMLESEFDAINSDIQKTVGEFVNIIYGQARRKLNEVGLGFMDSLSTIHTSPNHLIGAPQGLLLTLVVPFETSSGPFFLQFIV
jgi:CheY-specific phosphatase CheX/FixJ family two-component response regulator